MSTARILTTLDDLAATLATLRAEVEREARGEAPAPEAVFMTLDQYAKRRLVSRRTVLRWIILGMPAQKRGKTTRIPVREADAWEENAARTRSAEIAATRGKR